MTTRRDVLKSSAAALVAGVAGAPAAAVVTATPAGADPTPYAGPAVSSYRPGGTGPLYWSTYGYNNATNEPIPEDVWKANVDWVAETFRPHGFTMVCTDGWVDYTQKVTPNGYIRSLNDSWAHDWVYWAKYVQAKGMKLGVYYNPLWVTRSAVEDTTITVVGRPEIKVADLVNPGDYLNSDGELYWVDVSRDGAEEYVKGCVDHFRQLGAVFLRIDFLAWYEIGFDQAEGTTGMAHGRESYLQALAWMREAAGQDMMLSLVMPNLFDHGAGERRYGDLVRIDQDVSYGTWIALSEGPQTWQPTWSQWTSPFLGFTGFSDISGWGQMILDGDPINITSFTNDLARESAVSLFTMAGAPIAIADQYDTIGPNAPFFTNPEVLALRRAGLVGKPLYANPNAYSFDPTSRDPQRWVGQLPDGSWAVALFNRSDDKTPVTQAIEFSALGLSAPAAVRDLWAHEDLGSMSGYSISLQPHQSVLLLVTPKGAPVFQAEVGAWAGSARFENFFTGFQGSGYVTGLGTPGASVGVLVERHGAGAAQVTARVANATGSTADLAVSALDPHTGHVHGTARLGVPTSTKWSRWRQVPVHLEMAAGNNLVVFSAGTAGVANLDSFSVT